MSFLNTLGTVAGTLTTISLVPQAVRIWKSRSAVDVSLLSYAIYSLGLAFWMLYGLFDITLGVIISSAVSLALSSFIVMMILRFRNKE